MWDWIRELIEKWFSKQRPRPDEPKPDEPKPDKPDDSDKWINESAGYRIRLKDYHNSPNKEHKGRRTSVKIDTRFHKVMGMTDANTKVTVDNEAFVYYGVDAENGKHDLAFADGKRFPEDYNKPCYLRIYKDGELHTVVRIAEWKYGSVVVEEEVKNV